MARLSRDQWDTVRAEREAGAGFRELAGKHGVSHQAIQKRAKAEGWGDGRNVEDAIARRTAEKVAGVVATGNPKKTAAAIDAEAERRVAVVARHRKEWEQVAQLRDEAITARHENQKEAFERAKLAKITAEMTAIQQAGERKAWGLDAAEAAPNQGVIVVNLRRAPEAQS